MGRTTAVMGSALLGLSVAAWASSASAQDQYQQAQQYQATQEAPWQGVLPAPKNAFELRLGTGYTQGLGHIAPGTYVVDVAGAGISGTLDLDYRVNPFWSIGGEAQYQEFTRENNNGARGLAMNIGVTGHFAPFRRIDPFFRLGSGYRILWDVNQLKPISVDVIDPS